MKNSAGPHQSV